MERAKFVVIVLYTLVQVLTCLLLVGQTRAQASIDHNSFWYDVPSAPLKFTLPEFDPNYSEMQMVQIRSTTGKVVRYDLGCIHLENGKPLATATIRSWQLDQAPEDQLFPRNVLRITAKRCIEKSEFLGVIRVQYQDGGVWQLLGPSASSFVPEPPMSLTITSPNFANGGDIAKKFTCDGADLSPQLAWTDPPASTKAFALLADDPDAPVGNWNHWTAWNLPANLRGLPEGVAKDAHLPDGTEQGRNDFGKPGYNGPCPPPGKPHRYYFKLFALDGKLNLKAEAGKKEVEAAMKGHVLAEAEVMGRYGR